MKLSYILSQHDSAKEDLGISQSLGDCYLIQHNQVFRKIREKTLNLNFKFSSELSPGYLAFPMGQLENILNSKILYYFDNTTPLQILNSSTGGTLDWDHVIDNLKPNYVFHESCHAVARSLSFKSSEISNLITTMLVEESFANTCEFLAIADAQEPIHRCFLEVNSYFTVFEDRTHLKNAIAKYGRFKMIKFMLLCYLHSNFLNDQLSEKDLRRVIDFVEFENLPELRVLRSLSQNAFALNPRFRFATAEMYLRLNGVNFPVKQALNFDYFANLAQSTKLRNFINQLCESVK